MAKRKTVSRPDCKGCGIKFTPKTKRQKYHSEECRKAYYERHYFIKTKVSKTCPNCGIVFVTTMPKKQTYCLPECREDARKKRIEALGASVEAERMTYLGERMAALERDGFKCTVCGRGVKDNAVLDVVEKEERLVTVCTDCKAGREANIDDTRAKRAKRKTN